MADEPSNELTPVLSDFLARQGYEFADIRAMPQDASTRRYLRLRGQKLILMDDTLTKDHARPFVALSEALLAMGLSAPKVVAHDVEKGLVLHEDFGELSFARCLALGHDERDLYRTALDALIALHRVKEARDIPQPHYRFAPLMEEVGRFYEWFVPTLREDELEEQARQDYDTAWAEVLAQLDPEMETLVLRDFHVDNMLLLPERPSPRKCGLIDFQHAMIGSRAYDLASLLEDARRDVSEAVVSRMRADYVTAFTDLDPIQFDREYTIMAAQRHFKVAGLFVRLYLRDQRPAYLKHMPRVLRMLKAKLNDPLMSPVYNWIDQYLPQLRRPNPEAQVFDLAAIRAKRNADKDE